MADLPVIYEDRIPQSILAESHSDILSLLNEGNKGKIGSKDRVHFCGLAHVSPSRSVFFLPRNLASSKVSADTRNGLAKLTMKAMARYGRETATRIGVSPAEGDRSSLVTIVENIATDFFLYGIYSERTRIRGRNAGKPDWKRTVQTLSLIHI